MRTVGVIGLGNMGMGIAKNLLKAGFTTRGYDLFEAKREELKGYGGVSCSSPAEVGDGAEVVFVMVMNGAQALDVAFGENGLCKTMKPGSVLFLTATIGMGYAQQLAKGLQEYGIEMIDSGVSGGLSGAHNGTLTLMASGKKEVYDSCKDVMDAIASNPNHVGTEPGQGQVVKSCLQALIGAESTATFELLVMGAKAGVDPQILLDVIGTSGGGCGVFKNCVPLIMDRKFKDTGSAITTMSKDLNITMDLAREVGCYMPTTASARELFMAGLTRYPDEDNWSITKILEEIAGVQVKRK